MTETWNAVETLTDPSRQLLVTKKKKKSLNVIKEFELIIYTSLNCCGYHMTTENFHEKMKYALRYS